VIDLEKLEMASGVDVLALCGEYGVAKGRVAAVKKLGE
jgi:hypothetical protein